MHTEEELIELRGTDSDGTPLDLSVRPASLEKLRSESLFDRYTDAAFAPDEKNQLQKAISKGYRVDTTKAGPSGTRLFLLRVPI